MNELALPTLQGIELFSGVGMLGEGLRAGLDYMGFAYRSLCHVEREAYAASVLVARMEEGSMDAAPVWSDVYTFDARAWRGKVDCVVAGFPCQDLSVAGKRAGLDGKRSGLFFEVTRIADDSGAWFILLENVAGIASATATVMDEEEGELDERAAARVLGELADLGWDAEWITLSASDVGASHGRARWFCIAWKLDNADRIGAQRTGRAEFSTDAGCEDVDDAERSERRSPCAGIAGRQQGHDGGRAESHGRAGISDEVLANAPWHVGYASERQNGSGRRVCEASNELADSELSGQRASRIAERESPDAQSFCLQLAQPESIGRNQGRPESIGKQGRSDAAERGVPVADASNPRLQGNEQQSAYEPDGRTDGAGIMPTNCRISS